MLFTVALFISLLGECDSCFTNVVEEEVGAHVHNAMFVVGMCVSLIVVSCVACNEFIIVDDDGRGGKVGGLLFDFMEGDDVDDIEGGCALDIIDGIDDDMNDGSFYSSLNNTLRVLEACRLSSDFCFGWMESCAYRNSPIQSTVRCCMAIGSDCIVPHNSCVDVDYRSSPVLIVGWTSSMFQVVIPIEVGIREFENLDAILI